MRLHWVNALSLSLQPKTNFLNVMVAMKLFNMDMLTDVTMTRLFQLAEYVCFKTACVYPCNKRTKPTPKQEIAPTIRFSDQDRMVEGELFV